MTRIWIVLKTINEHRDYTENLAHAEEFIAAQNPDDFVKCRFSRDETACKKAIVIISFQPPRCWKCGNYGIPISLGMPHAEFKNDIFHGLRTMKALALEKLRQKEMLYPELVEQFIIKPEPHENDSWN